MVHGGSRNVMVSGLNLSERVSSLNIWECKCCSFLLKGDRDACDGISGHTTNWKQTQNMLEA